MPSTTACRNRSEQRKGGQQHGVQPGRLRAHVGQDADRYAKLVGGYLPHGISLCMGVSRMMVAKVGPA